MPRLKKTNQSPLKLAHRHIKLGTKHVHVLFVDTKLVVLHGCIALLGQGLWHSAECPTLTHSDQSCVNKKNNVILFLCVFCPLFKSVDCSADQCLVFSQLSFSLCEINVNQSFPQSWFIFGQFFLNCLFWQCLSCQFAIAASSGRKNALRLAISRLSWKLKGRINKDFALYALFHGAFLAQIFMANQLGLPSRSVHNLLLCSN